jgi:type I restriction enzyme, S subunit
MELEAFFEQFELLADAPNGVQKLRQLILQLAVQGKLVPQDPNDEPAAVLLERIEAEKARLVKEGKIKKEKKLLPIEIENVSAQLPKGWTVAYLGDLVTDFQNGIFKRKAEEGELIPVLRLADIKSGQLSEASLREIPLTSIEIDKYKVSYGDILIVRVNGSADLVGRFVPCLVNKRATGED